MKKILFGLACALALASSAVLTSSAWAVPLDVDADGRSDFLVISIGSGGALEWRFYTAGGSLISTRSALGSVGDQISIANWSNTTPQAGYITRSTAQRKALWVVAPTGITPSQFTFGGVSRTFIAGADFGASAACDAAIVQKRGTALRWTLAFDPFATLASKPKLRSFNFGKSADLAFYLSLDRQRDIPAVARTLTSGGTQVELRAAGRSTSTKINFSDITLGSSAPLPVSPPSGADLLAFIERKSTSTVAHVRNLSAQVVADVELPGKGDVVVGDYLTAAGEEIAISLSQGGFYIVNPIYGVTSQVNLPSGIAVDEININSFGSASDPPAGGGSGGGACNSADKDPSDGTDGFLWKPVSDSTRNLAIHVPAELTGNVDSVQVADPSGNLLETGVYGGVGNGNRVLARFSKPGSSYPNNCIVLVNITGGCIWRYTIPNTAARWD